MSRGIVTALIRKDLTLLFRNKVLSILPASFIIVVVIIYYLMPRTIDENFDFAVYGAVIPPFLVEEWAEEGVRLTYMESVESLKQGVDSGDYFMGIVFPEDLLIRLSSGDRPEVTAIFAPSVLPEIRDAEVKMIEQLVFVLQGEPLQIDEEEELILGPDMTGRQIPLRDRLLPIFAVFIILAEIMSMATLIAEEFDRGIINALRVTSMGLGSLLTAKAAAGVGLAFLQAVLLLAVTGCLWTKPLLLIAGLLLGSGLVVGLGFLVAAFSRDMMTVIAWSMPVMLILFLPALNVIMPGLISPWIRGIPSFYLTDLLHRTNHFEAGWGEMGRHLMILGLYDFLLVILGYLALRSKPA